MGRAARNGWWCHEPSPKLDHHIMAAQVYERMLAAGIKPSATTYTALISAYGRSGQVEKALEIFQVRG